MSIRVDESDPPYDQNDAPFQPRDVQVRQDKWVTEEFVIEDILGRGKFGEVKRCREKYTNKLFAAKFISAPGPQDKKDVVHEINIMKRLQHRRLLQLYDAFESKNEMCLVLEIILGGELFDRVIDDDFILTERACVAFMRQICEGVEYMHSKKIIHLDMKPENILCLSREGNRIKIIDFGLARDYNGTEDLRVLFGTPEFMAPEVVQYDPINFATDMWSVGVICYVLLSGLSPFMGKNDADTLTNVIKGAYDFDYPEFDDITDTARDFIAQLLKKNKNSRLTASQCLQHPWLRRTEPRTPVRQLSKKRLRKFVIRRKWQKIYNAMIALKRMGFQLSTLRRGSVANNILKRQESIFGWEYKHLSNIPPPTGSKTPDKSTKPDKTKRPESLSPLVKCSDKVDHSDPEDEGQRSRSNSTSGGSKKVTDKSPCRPIINVIPSEGLQNARNTKVEEPAKPPAAKKQAGGLRRQEAVKSPEKEDENPDANDPNKDSTLFSYQKNRIQAKIAAMEGNPDSPRLRRNRSVHGMQKKPLRERIFMWETKAKKTDPEDNDESGIYGWEVKTLKNRIKIPPPKTNKNQGFQWKGDATEEADNIRRSNWQTPFNGMNLDGKETVL